MQQEQSKALCLMPFFIHNLLAFICSKQERTHCMEKYMPLHLNLINECYLIGSFVRFIYYHKQAPFFVTMATSSAREHFTLVCKSTCTRKSSIILKYLENYTASFFFCAYIHVCLLVTTRLHFSFGDLKSLL